VNRTAAPVTRQMRASVEKPYVASMNFSDMVNPQNEFADFLKAQRRCIPPESATLGSWQRLPVRRGRRVTQEEIAEALGVSRNWYRRLESGEAIRPSTRLLDRLAGVFGFTPEQRMQLFILGIPEMAYMRMN
jgi:DNA-binding XRE family transcriptional regulator